MNGDRLLSLAFRVGEIFIPTMDAHITAMVQLPLSCPVSASNAEYWIACTVCGDGKLSQSQMPSHQ